MGKLKRTTEEVAEYFRQQGCELMDEYMGAQEPMDYKCSCGNYGTGTWNNFSRGKRCGQCSKHGLAKKRHIDDVRQIFIERKCEFLDSEYHGVHHKHNYRCKCGRESQITFSEFYTYNSRCKECGIHKGEKHWAWKPDRDKLRQDELFRKKCYKALSSTLKAVGKQKVGHTTDMLGYTPKELQEHIINHPNWARVKDTNWHLDHKFPMEAFLEHGIKDVKMINCLDNLQPLTQKENNQKKDKYDKIAFLAWLEVMMTTDVVR